MTNPTPQPQQPQPQPGPQGQPAQAQSQPQPPSPPQYRPSQVAAGAQPGTPPAGGPGQAPAQAVAQAHAHPAQPYGAGPAAYGPPGDAQFAPAGHPQQPAHHQLPPNGSLHFTRMLQSEWTKIRTVRSTAWSLVVMVVLIIGMAALLGATVSGTDDEPDPSVSLSLIGVMIAQIAAASLGVLTISAEYTTGMIRSTLTAFPRRVTVLAAKAVVFGVLMFVVGLVACYLAYLIGDAMLTRDMVVDSEGKDVVKGVVGSATYLSLLGLFSLGIGTMLRHSAGAITTVLGIMLVPSIFGGFIPGKVGEWVVNYSPMSLLINMVAPSGELESPLGPWPGMILMAGYAAAALVGAAALMKARDV